MRMAAGGVYGNDGGGQMVSQKRGKGGREDYTLLLGCCLEASRRD